ncbi:copper chaperone PCu(A)C [Yoonia sp.]|uniref:copper chaperone PCu(A)C n=1 Tax=Yoonia sp. TaxID=2212373 RepID=UPI0025F1A6DB|nr:copper chaperone PCu(A)C [Yoonia sp.]
MKTKMKLLAALVALGAPAMADDMAPVTQDTLTLTDGYAYATLPNQPVAGGFLTIANGGEADDHLVAAASDIAGVTQIHAMMMDGGVMVMRELADGLPLPAGETVVLQSGGLHLMFMQLNGPLVAGETVAVTLRFENAGEVAIDLPIRKKMAGGMDHSATGGH